MIVTIPGGQALLRDKPSVGGIQLVRSEAVPFYNLLQDALGKTLEDATGEEQKAAVDRLQARPTAEFVRANYRLENAAIVAMVRSWTLPEPTPTLDTVEEMDPAIHAALTKAVAPRVMELISGVDLTPQGALTRAADGTPVLDQQSPTLPSSASSSGGPAAPMSTTGPTAAPSNGTGSTSSVPSFT